MSGAATQGHSAVHPVVVGNAGNPADTMPGARRRYILLAGIHLEGTAQGGGAAHMQMRPCYLPGV